MTSVTSRCPHCFYTIRIGKRPGDYSYGSPLQTCPKCNKGYIDNYYREIECEGIRPSSLWRVQPFGIVFLSIAFFLLLVFIFSGAGLNTYIIILFLLIVPAIDIIGYGNRMDRIKKEEELSKQRLSNEAYAVALKKAGYYVPDEYLKGYNLSNISSDFRMTGKYTKVCTKCKNKVDENEKKCSKCKNKEFNYIDV